MKFHCTEGKIERNILLPRKKAAIENSSSLIQEAHLNKTNSK
jgi:hypothetical protein